jgi:hypothetical protein
MRKFWLRFILEILLEKINNNKLFAKKHLQK